jgi:hypothetical protein
MLALFILKDDMAKMVVYVGHTLTTLPRTGIKI